MSLAWTPWRLADLIRMRQAGRSVAECAAALGVSENVVDLRLRAMFDPMSEDAGLGRHAQAERRRAKLAIARRMRAEGASLADVAERFRVSRGHAQRLLRGEGRTERRA
jgi:AraC-like DNA-binding protein